jgi:predicted Fe-S protein YdhL (DUF1289 family)
MQSGQPDFNDSPPLTPCIGVCTLDASGLCRGCRRSMAEIAGWRDMSEAERRQWIGEVQPLRPPAPP